jgi:FlgD Ig-like domain
MMSPRSFARALALTAACIGAASSAFAQTTPCPDPPLQSPVSARVEPAVPCAGQPVSLVFETCGPCWDIRSADYLAGGIVVRSQSNGDCTRAVCLHESATVQLGQLAPGHHAFVVRYASTLVMRDSASADSVLCTFTHLDTVEFDVAFECPPPPPGPLPYLASVTIGQGAPCDTCPAVVCSGDSIAVRFAGSFPSSCYAFAGVVLFPSANPSAPPLIRLLYEQDECVNRPCLPVVTPWQGMVVLPPLPAVSAGYRLPVEAVLKHLDCQGGFTPEFLGLTRFPFAVTDTCGVPPGNCYLAGFDVPYSPSPMRCDAFVGPGRPASVTWSIASPRALDGLQGRLVLPMRLDLPGSPSVLQVSSIEAIGPAAGMRLQWQPTPDGARFVLFSEGQAQIPPAPDSAGARVSVLRIEVSVRPGVPLPDEPQAMTMTEVIAADHEGNAVPVCPTITLDIPRDQFAVFCVSRMCDLNGDGSRDVRDLVRMVNCLHGLMLCDSTGLDCEDDNDFDLDDVMCCARGILNGGAADTSGAVPDPALSVHFGAPVVTDGIVEVPVTLEGGETVAGARLALRYPGDRFVVDDVVFPGRSTWLQLFEDGGDRVTVGLIGLQPPSGQPFRHSFTLRLALRPGQSLGGEIGLAGADFSNADGVALVGNLGAPSLSLVVDLATSTGQPNPFGREIGFSVTMARAGDLDVTVHDVSGREVASLHRGSAVAGPHTFRWDGTRDDGEPMSDGIYFIRARALDATIARKAILLRER